VILDEGSYCWPVRPVWTVRCFYRPNLKSDRSAALSHHKLALYTQQTYVGVGVGLGLRVSRVSRVRVTVTVTVSVRAVIDRYAMELLSVRG